MNTNTPSERMRPVAWVTGSSRGIGRAIAEALAQSGHDVVLHGRAPENLRVSGEGEDLYAVASEMGARTGRDIFTVCGDLQDESAVRACLAEITAHYGHLDVLVCNAGGANLTAQPDRHLHPDAADDFLTDEFQARLSLNLLPTVLCCREALPLLRQSPCPRIVTIGSITGCGGNKSMGTGFMPYSLAKAAVHQYTRCLAGKLRPEGIPVNCVIPGNINTPTTRIRFGGDRETPVPGLSRLEHVGTPEDIAGLVDFLCGPGGAYISGQCIRVDGAEQLYPC